MDHPAPDTFDRLVDCLHDEIVRRDPAYSQRYAIPVTSPELVRQRFPACFTAMSDEVAHLYRDGLAQLRCDGLTLVEGEGDDPLGAAVSAGLIDAARAALGMLDLRPPSQDIRSLAEVLQQDFVEHRLADGRRCFVAHHGEIPLLVVNALGFTIDFWRPLLVDAGHDFRVVVVEARYGDLFTGGMKSAARLDTHADDLAEAMNVADVGPAAVLGWCNGGRVALDFAARHPDRVSAITLLSPTLRGARRAETASPSPFEENMQHIMQSVSANPKLAPIVSQMLRQMFKAPAWDAFDSESARARTLLSLPDRSLAELMLTAMATATDVLNTVQRNAVDERHPIHEALEAIERPIAVVLGDCDGVVSNAQTRAVMTCARRAVFAEVRGAGHYIHHLQYPYLRHLMSRCLVPSTASGAVRTSSARITVTQP